MKVYTASVEEKSRGSWQILLSKTAGIQEEYRLCIREIENEITTEKIGHEMIMVARI